MSSTSFDLRVLNLLPVNHDVMELHPHGTTVAHALVAEAFEVRAATPMGTFTGAVLSKPAGSTADWTAGSFTCDVPGTYVLTGQNGSSLGATTFTIKAFPAAALTHTLVASPFPTAPHVSGGNGPTVYSGPNRLESTVRIILRGIAQNGYGNVTDAAFAALTTDRPIPTGLNLPHGTTGGTIR